MLPNGMEVFAFGIENTLKIFPPNTFKFNPKGHIVLDDIQQCILDNFWFQYNAKREEKGYMLSILNSLAEYFNMMNKKLPKSGNIEQQEIKPLYVLFDGKKPGIYITFEEILQEKLDARKKNEDLTWRKYFDVNEAIFRAKTMIGENYYTEPKAQEYIQKSIRINKGNTPPPSPHNTNGESSNSKKVKKEESPITQTYKACLLKGVDPLDSKHIDLKIDEKFANSSKRIKEELKEEILKELREELEEKFEEIKKDIKKEYDSKYEIDFSDEDHMDIAGQKLE
jgi:hypothetical protein